MHLIASQPGGFSDDEGIVDLQQTPANFIVLSAADSTLAALIHATESLSDSMPSVRLANWMQLTKPAAFDLYRDSVLDHADVVVLSLLGGRSYWPYGLEQLEEWVSQGKNRKLIVVPGDDAVDEDLLQASNVDATVAQNVWQYLRQGGAENSRQFFNFIANEFFDHDIEWRPPETLPNCLMYLPESAHQRTGATLPEWQARWAKQNCDGAVCAVLFYKSHLQSANTKVFDDFISQLEGQGLKPLPIALTSLKDAESIRLTNELLVAADARLIINTTGFSSNRAAAPDLSSKPSDFESSFDIDVPVLQVVLSSSTEEDWQTQSQGLRSRDIAMQIVLPEMDGRVITRAISFKAESYFSDRTESSVVRYELHQERARFVAELAKNITQLADKPTSKRRVALVLANYPTKDGRIGNGVGLDTPESTIQILNAMQSAGYPVEVIPEDGTALIRELLQSVTNNPNTLHFLPCWQSLGLERYQEFLNELPQESQQAVLNQWGSPEADPKYREGRLMLSGIRLGETFVGIQPARGFNVDLSANYHDPDLIPPHSYLAFYFWLRHEYGIDAIVHVGKHGNLEWLPGKGSALSNQCWPDIALGPIPHLYPFIVNDPGEGAQAKRRAQAVIIDHLMPPITRAEVYGELAELEGLVDEYYQALGMDSRRENWLREQIVEQAKRTHILDELASKNSDDDEILETLDAYLCDIKEAQIRHGLHIFGALPNDEKLSDTLVALLRLPRGTRDAEQGILHNLATDLKLTQKSSDDVFDPFEDNLQPWTGSKPGALLGVSSDSWRTTADTRERLELLAQDWVRRFVIKQEKIPEHIRIEYPGTSTQLDFAKQTLLTALETSATQEIEATLTGLNGKFVDPGPSGAPTRGRLDTLPTGRNFYSVDNRSIPSQAAWAIGQKSAQALIERHLQEHGDYPKELGLSVWGTATMRTGGDDIAQAFWLMGVRPIWASGSQRVVDFEVLSTQLLQRPRVDVTLRVSGFFRDAFPNVMRLFDAAVIAVSKFEESGGANPIKENIQNRKLALINEGLSEAQAERQASYRVFGSKPGAYGAGLQGLIDERCWETKDDLAEAYVNWGGYAYGSDKESRDGLEAKRAFAHRLSNIDTVVQNQDNREHDLLDSDDYYQFQGGMTNAVTQLKGSAPEVYHNDHSNPAKPKVRTLKEELNRVIRSRVLNPKWINAMKEHGYKGAFEMAATVDYVFAYDATTNLIDDYQYQKVSDALILDPETQAFLKENNPNALEEMAERMLEATQRGLWASPGETAEQLQDLLLDLDAEGEGRHH